MKNDLSSEQIAKLKETFEDMLDNGPWDQTNFLKVIGKKIESLRDEFLAYLNEKTLEETKERFTVTKLRGHKQIYISLYTASGDKIKSWERLLANLPRQTTSRAIYEEEDHVKAIMRSKTDPSKDAYIAVFVNQDDLLHVADEKIPKDKLGNKLLTLKDRTLNLENVSRFVHVSGIYDYVNGRLIKIIDADDELSS